MTLFPSYLKKTCVRHSASCFLSRNGKVFILTCVLDMINRLKAYLNILLCSTKGIFGEYILSNFLLLDKDVMVKLIYNIIDKLVHIRKACHEERRVREHTHTLQYKIVHMS